MVKKCNSNQKWNKDKCRCECKNLRKRHMCEKNFIWNSSTCTCENGKCSGSIIGDEIIKVTRTTPTKPLSTETISAETFATKIVTTNSNGKR